MVDYYEDRGVEQALVEKVMLRSYYESLGTEKPYSWFEKMLADGWIFLDDTYDRESEVWLGDYGDIPVMEDPVSSEFYDVNEPEFYSEPVSDEGWYLDDYYSPSRFNVSGRSRARHPSGDYFDWG